MTTALDHPTFGEKMPVFSQHCPERGVFEYHVQFERTTLKLSATQAAALLYQMLKILPEVPINFKHDFKKMSEPVMVYIKRYKAVDGEIVVDRQRSRSELRVLSGHEYREDTYDGWILDDKVSYTIADEDATIQQLEAYCRSRGITMKQALEEMKGESES